MQLAQGGSVDAFTEIVGRHHVAVRRFVMRFVNDSNEADDLSQEVFLAVVRNLENVSSGQAVRAWLFSIAKFKAMDHLRRRYRQSDRKDDLIEREIRVRKQRLLESIGTQSEDEVFSDLQACMEQLDGNKRKLIEEFYFKNRTAESMAKALERSAGSVRMALTRIRMALRSCMERKMKARGHHGSE
ncbi:MAG: sigma-70 family RNA polymerase sigma factor [Pirellulaceae bacterium]